MTLNRTAPLAAALTILFALAAGASIIINSGRADAGYFAIASAIALATLAVLLGPVRARASRRSAYVLAGLAVVTIPLFWLGLPEAVGAGAIAAGRDTRTPQAVAAGALAFAAGVVASIIG